MGIMQNRNIIAFIIIAVILIGGIYFYKVNQTEGIIYPKGGETLVAGKTYTVKWRGDTNPIASTTDIFLVDQALLSQGASVSIVDRKYGIEDNGSYEYTIPGAVQESEYFFVVGTTTSNPFKIIVTPQ